MKRAILICILVALPGCEYEMNPGQARRALTACGDSVTVSYINIEPAVSDEDRRVISVCPDGTAVSIPKATALLD